MATTHILTHWGPHLIEADADDIVGVHDHPTDPDPSALGQGLLAAKRNRVARPSVRKSWLDGGPGTATHRRGKEPFVEVEWDEAFDLVAAELTRVRDDHGYPSLFGGSYGWGSAGLFHMAGPQLRRFLRIFGGYTDRRGTYSSCAADIITPYIYGLGWYPAGAQQTSWSNIANHCELFVSFGSLRLNNAQVTYAGQGPHLTRGWIAKSAANGTSFVNIGPIRDDQCTEANGRWVPIRPGTDVALMAAIGHTLITENLTDEDFLASHCVGWPQVKAYLLGETDGQPKTAAWAAEITTIAEGEIIALTREMAAKRTLINLSFSVQRCDHGEQSYWMAAALASALGQIGTPGGGIAFSFGSHGRFGAGQRAKSVPRLPVGRFPEGLPIIPVSHIAQMLERPGERYNFDGREETYPDIRMIYWAGGNPFHHHQDLNRLMKAWEKPETIVVHEPFWGPMAKFADIVLPATTPLERSDFGDGETMLVATRPATGRYGDAKDDYDILAGVAERLGLADEFTEGRTSDQWLEHLYDGFREANPYAPSFEQFLADGYVRHPDMDDHGAGDHVFLKEFRANPVGSPLATPSGRIELYSETIAGFGYADCPPHPTWMEPYERLGTPAAERFGLHLVSNQPTTRLHSQFDHSDHSRDAKIHDREPARMHPSNANERGLNDGDAIRIWNDRGSCLAGLSIDDAIAPGCVQLATGAWFDPDGSGMCKHGNPNVLTADRGTSQLAQGPTAHTCIVEVERYDGELPRVTAFDLPEFAGRS